MLCTTMFRFISRVCRDYNFFPCLQHLCDREQSKGRQLLTTLAALFVSNNDKDIEIEISIREEGWQIIGSKVKVRDN